MLSFKQRLYSIVASASGLIAAHAQLLGIELREEIERLWGLLILGAVTLVFALMSLLLLTATILLCYWETHRITATCLLASGYALLALLCYNRLQKRFSARAPLFSLTASEFDRNRQLMESADTDSAKS